MCVCVCIVLTVEPRHKETIHQGRSLQLWRDHPLSLKVKYNTSNVLLTMDGRTLLGCGYCLFHESSEGLTSPSRSLWRMMDVL